MRRALIVTVAVLGVWACGQSAGDSEPAVELTQRQKDSIVGSLPVPGSKGVLGAMDKASRSRPAARHDADPITGRSGPPTP